MTLLAAAGAAGQIHVVLIAAVGLIAAAVAAERGRVLWRAGRPVPPSSLAAALDLLAAGRGDAALAAVRGDALRALLPAAVEGFGGSHDQLERLLGEAAERETQRLQRLVWLLAVAANVAPVLGYLGAVAGMVDTFTVIGEFGLANPALTERGLHAALRATLAGLFVAAPALLVYSVFTLRLAARLREMEEVAGAILARHGSSPA